MINCIDFVTITFILSGTQLTQCDNYCSDEDMQSIISLLSVNNSLDIAPLDDLEDIPDLEITNDLTDHMLDLTSQLEQLTSSLTGSDLATTPLSGNE